MGGFGQYAKQYVSPSFPLTQYPSNLRYLRLSCERSASLPEIETAQEKVACQRKGCHMTLRKADSKVSSSDNSGGL